MIHNPQQKLKDKTPTSSQTDKRRYIMLISDDVELAETLQIELASEGYQVSVIHDGIRGLLAVNRMKPDLVVLSWSPPRLSALEICDRLRANHCEGAIILLTNEDNPQDRIAGLKAGADDCLSMPIIKEEFIARIRANSNYRNHDKPKVSVLRCCDIVLNRNTREVFRYGRLIRLTATEFNLLEYLMEHYFQVLTRSQILESVWGYEYTGSSNIIEVYIRYLRNKLETTPADRVIHTIRSVGYILREPI